MRLLEYQGKQLLQEAGIRTPRGVLVQGTDGPVTSDLPLPVLVKAQVRCGGRFKKGGIRRVETPSDLPEAVAAIMGMTLDGEPVRRVLIEELVAVSEELYLSALVDRDRRALGVIFSRRGGVDIEHVPDAEIHRLEVDPLALPAGGDLCSWFVRAGVQVGQAGELATVARALLSLLTGRDMLVAEINPLVIAHDGTALALDAKCELDEAARHRQLGIEDLSWEVLGGFEARMRELRYAGIELTGKIGIIASGAGEGMALLDSVTAHGGPGGRCCVDLLRGAEAIDNFAPLVEAVLELKPAVLLFSAFYQVANGEDYARVLAEIWRRQTGLPRLVVRLKGRGAERAAAILDGVADFFTASPAEACAQAIERASTRL